MKLNKGFFIAFSLLAITLITYNGVNSVYAKQEASKVGNLQEERKVLEEKIKKGEVVPVNPVVNVYDENNNLVWQGKADEWNKVEKEIIKAVKESQK